MSRLKDWLKRTPLYPLLRAARHALRSPSLAERIEARDAQATDRILCRLLRPHDHCVDVGAHRGDLLAAFFRYAPHGRHVAIEPIPELAAELRDRFPDAEIHAAAATDVPGELTFRVVRSALAFSGIERRPDLPADAEVVEIRVPAVRLDDMIPTDRPVRLVKVDVEGAEGHVLRGAAGLLGRCRPWVLFEHGSASAAYGMSTDDVFAELERHGLAVWTLTGWLADEPPLGPGGFRAAVASGQYWNFLAGVRS